MASSSSTTTGGDSTPSSATNTTTTTSSSMMATAKYQDPKFVSKQVNEYCLKLGFKESPAAQKLRLATAAHPKCRMMGDPTEAAFFKSVLIPAIGAKRIVEVGVFTGYTTLCLAEALLANGGGAGEQGKIYALDVNREFTDIGQEHWKEVPGVQDCIDLRIGPAVESLQHMLEKEQMQETIDFAFIDADKVNYHQYYELLLKLLRPNGIIAIDNVLWAGRVLDESFTDDDTVALREISKHVHADDRVEHVLLPFADGVTLVRKK